MTGSSIGRRQRRLPGGENGDIVPTHSSSPTKKPATNGSPSASNASRLPATLGLNQLLVSALLVTIFGGFFLSFIGQYQLARDLLLAGIRATAQLFLLGGFILQKLFGTTKPAIVWTWIIGVGILASQEALSRVEYTYDKLGRHMTLSLLAGGIGVMSLALAGRVFGELDPWFQPRTLIPTAGMLFGNALPAVSLGTSTLTREFAQSSAQTELRLALGANAHEAIKPIIRTSLSTALTPTVNSLAATGIVQIPGTMTGMVLSGQTPRQAALYQSMILFLITATACSTVQLMTSFVSHELMNWNEVRLQTSRLVRVDEIRTFSLSSPIQSARNVASAWFTPLPNGVEKERHALLTTTTTRTLIPVVESLRNVSDGMSFGWNDPLLTVNKLRIERSYMEISFNLTKGDRLGVTGTTGIGKTQLLKTIAGLEHVEGEMTLNGVPSFKRTWPEWRRHICWVSQDRTTLDGTPRDFFEEVRTFHSQKRRKSASRHPVAIAADWGLDASAFDRPWSNLSGGEAQRASLAIALSLEPKVLLLDEITAGLDEATQLAVEETLASSDIPIVMVTHSRMQLNRFCTHHMDLNEARVIT